MRRFGSEVGLVHGLATNAVPLREHVCTSDVTFEDRLAAARAGFVQHRS